jgi:hypothetical protein
MEPLPGRGSLGCFWGETASSKWENPAFVDDFPGQTMAFSTSLLIFTLMSFSGIHNVEW